jgi:hypothetical protein
MFTHWYPSLLFVANVYFLIEYLLRLYTAKNLTKYLSSLENLVEVITILPYIIVSLSVKNPFEFWNFFVRMLDILRILVFFRLLKYTENEISRELSRIIVGGKT